ncbi:peptidylprolyl isomerase [Oxalobacteraceae bacterium CAVE-383]|nr:peptidylprolyl isomerase [Oxalobacteraceae bacterium CAVE-383]
MKSKTKFALLVKINSFALLGSVLSALAGAAAAQTASAPANAGAVVARMGTVTLGTAEVQRMYKDLPEADRAAVQKDRAASEKWLRGRLTAEALLREARSKGVADKPEVKARIADAMREVTANIVSSAYLESVSQVSADYPSEAETQAAYEQAKDNFKLPAIYHVGQIFVKTASTGKAAVAAAKDKAKKLAKQAKDGDFAAVARAASEDAPSAERGGDVGSVPLTNLKPEIQETVASMKKGQISDPIQSDKGFHIIKVIDIQPARTAGYEEMKPRLQAIMRQQRQQQNAQNYLGTLAPAASIAIDNAALDAALAKPN